MTAPRLKVVTTTDGSKPSRAGNKYSSPRSGTATFGTIGNFARTELDDLLRKAMDLVDDVCFERSDKAGSERERKCYFDAMREFRNQRDGLQSYFGRQMQRSLDELVRQSTYGRGHDEDVTRIEATGTEDKIAIDNLVSRARLEFEGELYAINERVKALLGMTVLDADDNPFDPGPICENFHAASTLLEIGMPVKLTFYKLFEKQLIASLGGFYRELNRQFIEHGVLPTIGTGGTGIKSGNSAGAASKPATGVVDALTRLQKTLNTERSPNRIDPAKFRRAIRQKIDALCRENRQSLSSRDSKSADAVAMLFDFFFEDEALPDPIKVLIGRLQIPILKVAILEPDFLTRKQHPARRLLDNVSRASLGWSDNHRDTRLLVGKTRELVDYIVARYEADVAVFDAACREFENFLAGNSAGREQAEAAPRGRDPQRKRQANPARQATAALIDRLTRGRELDPGVVDFLHTTWTSVLVKTYLSLGESSNHWRNLKRISTTLVWTLIPRHTEAERDKIMRTIPALLRALAKGMTLINTDMQTQNRVFAVLAREHARVVRQTSQNIVTRVDDITVWPEDDEERELAMTGNIDDDEISITCVDPDRIDDEADVVSLIDSLGTNEVIKNLNQFTAGVRKGLIRIDEEIVLSGDDDLELYLDEVTRDSYLKLATELPTGSWVEFIRADRSRQVLKLSWKSKAPGTLVFVNRDGHKVKNMAVNDFAAELRAKTARCVQTTSAFARAFFGIASKLQR